jgi:hypothetical protein
MTTDSADPIKELTQLAESLEQGFITDSPDTRLRMTELRDLLLAGEGRKAPPVQEVVARAGKALCVDREEAERIVERDLPGVITAMQANEGRTYSPEQLRRSYDQLAPAYIEALTTREGWLTPDKHLNFKVLGHDRTRTS